MMLQDDDDDYYIPPVEHFSTGRDAQQQFSLRDSTTQYTVAIVLVVLIQFRATWLGWIQYIRNRYRGLGLLEILWDLFELVYACLSAGLELGRTLLAVTSSAGLGLLEANDALPLEHVARRRRFSGTANMPELENVIPLTNDNETTSNGMVKKRKSHDAMDELEPAFLRDEDYPPGWMVYHPILGVVLKTEADKYQEKKAAETSETTTCGHDRNLSQTVRPE